MSMTIAGIALSPAPAPAGAAQPAPAVPGQMMPAPFAEWMGLGLQTVPAGDADAAAPVDAEVIVPGAVADMAPIAADADADAETADADAATTEVAVPQDAPALPSMMMSQPATLALPMATAMTMTQPAHAVPAATDGDTVPASAEAGAPVTSAAPASPNSTTIQASPAPAAPQGAQTAAAAQASPAFAAVFKQAAAPVATAPIAKADAAPAIDTAAAPAAAGIAAPAPAMAAAPELKLAGSTPAAWQQPLREALGDRLQLQLSRNIDQAVIRLDPPNLGRIEIAIRHMAGSLEVNISATHGEVVRQLHTISETMRTDLAQRQFGEVAVNVAATPRAAAAGTQSFDQQGRQRQQDRAQDDAGPGNALAEAGNPNSTFSLNARESYA